MYFCDGHTKHANLIVEVRFCVPMVMCSKIVCDTDMKIFEVPHSVWDALCDDIIVRDGKMKGFGGVRKKNNEGERSSDTVDSEKTGQNHSVYFLCIIIYLVILLFVV